MIDREKGFASNVFRFKLCNPASLCYSPSVAALFPEGVGRIPLASTIIFLYTFLAKYIFVERFDGPLPAHHPTQSITSG